MTFKGPFHLKLFCDSKKALRPCSWRMSLHGPFGDHSSALRKQTVWHSVELSSQALISAAALGGGRHRESYCFPLLLFKPFTVSAEITTSAFHGATFPSLWKSAVSTQVILSQSFDTAGDLVVEIFSWVKRNNIVCIFSWSVVSLTNEESSAHGL